MPIQNKGTSLDRAASTSFICSFSFSRTALYTGTMATKSLLEHGKNPGKKKNYIFKFQKFVYHISNTNLFIQKSLIKVHFVFPPQILIVNLCSREDCWCEEVHTHQKRNISIHIFLLCIYMHTQAHHIHHIRKHKVNCTWLKVKKSVNLEQGQVHGNTF